MSMSRSTEMRNDPLPDRELPTMPDPSKDGVGDGPHLPTMPDPVHDPERGQQLPTDPDPVVKPPRIDDPPRSQREGGDARDPAQQVA